MNKITRFIFAGAALAMVLAGCEKSDVAATASDASLTPSVANVSPIREIPKGDPSVPDAATVFAAQDAAEKAKAKEDTAALQEQRLPQEEMTKAEESTAMPEPGQANDHSTTALDKDKGG